MKKHEVSKKLNAIGNCQVSQYYVGNKWNLSILYAHSLLKAETNTPILIHSIQFNSIRWNSMLPFLFCHLYFLFSFSAVPPYKNNKRWDWTRENEIEKRKRATKQSFRTHAKRVSLSNANEVCNRMQCNWMCMVLLYVYTLSSSSLLRSQKCNIKRKYIQSNNLQKSNFKLLNLCR